MVTLLQGCSKEFDTADIVRDAISRQLRDLLLTLVGWAAPLSTRRVDFLSIKLGIRVCRDIYGLSNRSSSPHDLLLASLPSGR